MKKEVKSGLKLLIGTVRFIPWYIVACTLIKWVLYRKYVRSFIESNRNFICYSKTGSTGKLFLTCEYFAKF